MNLWWLLLILSSIALANPNWRERIEQLPQTHGSALSSPFTGIEVISSEDVGQGDFHVSVSEAPSNKLSIILGPNPTIVSCAAITHQLSQLIAHSEANGAASTFNMLKGAKAGSAMAELFLLAQKELALTTFVSSAQGFLQIDNALASVCNLATDFSPESNDVEEAQRLLTILQQQKSQMVEKFEIAIARINTGITGKADPEQILQVLQALSSLSSGLGIPCLTSATAEGITKMLEQFRGKIYI